MKAVDYECQYFPLFLISSCVTTFASVWWQIHGVRQLWDLVKKSVGVCCLCVWWWAEVSVRQKSYQRETVRLSTGEQGRTGIRRKNYNAHLPFTNFHDVGDFGEGSSALSHVADHVPGAGLVKQRRRSGESFRSCDHSCGPKSRWDSRSVKMCAGGNSACCPLHSIMATASLLPSKSHVEFFQGEP